MTNDGQISTAPSTTELTPHAEGMSRARSPSAHREEPGLRWFRWYGLLLGPLLGLYLFLDRGVAHVHVPGTPLYLGECVLAVGILGAFFGTRWVRKAVADDNLLAVVALFMLWGLARTIPNIPHYGVLNAVRDASLWYYAAFAILFVTVSNVVDELPARLVRGFSRIVPWLILWLPIALLISKAGLHTPHFPTSDVSAIDFKTGNIAVSLTIAISFLWLVPQAAISSRVRLALSFVGLMGLALVATQTRGGALAAGVGLLVAMSLNGLRKFLP